MVGEGRRQGRSWRERGGGRVDHGRRGEEAYHGEIVGQVLLQFFGAVFQRFESRLHLVTQILTAVLLSSSLGRTKKADKSWLSATSIHEQISSSLRETGDSLPVSLGPLHEHACTPDRAVASCLGAVGFPQEQLSELRQPVFSIPKAKR